MEWRCDVDAYRSFGGSMKVGTLVRFRGSIGLVIGKVEKKAAHPSDVWVQWNDESAPVWESGLRLEVVNASR